MSLVKLYTKQQEHQDFYLWVPMIWGGEREDKIEGRMFFFIFSS